MARVPLTDSLRALSRRACHARRFPDNTCPASRHLHLIADALARKQRYPSLIEDPQWIAETMLSVLASLWEARTTIAKVAALTGVPHPTLTQRIAAMEPKP